MTLNVDPEQTLDLTGIDPETLGLPAPDPAQEAAGLKAALQAEREKRRQFQEEARRLQQYQAEGWLEPIDQVRAKYPGMTPAEIARAEAVAASSAMPPDQGYSVPEEPLDPRLSRSLQSLESKLTALTQDQERQRRSDQERRAAEEAASQEAALDAAIAARLERYPQANPDAVKYHILHRMSGEEVEDDQIDELVAASHRSGIEAIKKFAEGVRLRQQKAAAGAPETASGLSPAPEGAAPVNLRDEDATRKVFSERARAAFSDQGHSF